MINQEQINEVSERLTTAQDTRREAEEAYDLAFIKQVNAAKRCRQQVVTNGYSAKDPDIFVKVVGNRPCTVTVKQPRQPNKRRIPFWWGFVAGLLTAAILVLVVALLIKVVIF